MTMLLDHISVVIQQKKLLDGICLSIDPSQLTLLLGPNGAGKSTLLKTCAGDIKPDDGAVVLNQRKLQNYNNRALACVRAVMTQSYEMAFSFTVREIVSMGCFVYEEQISRQQQMAIVEEVMDFMGIAPLADRHFMNLSGGEQQRTQLARVLVQLWYPATQSSPRYLLLDEPTSSLDIFHQYQVLALAQKLKARNIAVLAVVHDLSLAASFGDHIVLMDQGRIVVEGRPEEVLQTHHLQAVYGIGGHYFKHSKNTMPTVLMEEQ